MGEDGAFRHEGDKLILNCDCATTPPTMPLYRDRHLPTCPCAPYVHGLSWAAEVMADPALASVEMSGMDPADIALLREVFG